MTLSAAHFPDLPAWAQQLAGTLPLSALIEFIDVGLMLHLYELNERITFWNWPITPAGARLLLSSEDTHSACCLDRPKHSGILHCIDGKYGDLYPCSAPTATRLFISTKCDTTRLSNPYSNIANNAGRKQRLETIHVIQKEDKPPRMPLASNRRKYLAFVVIGWLLWVGLITVISLGGFYYVTTYYTIMPITGLIVWITHGYSTWTKVFAKTRKFASRI